MPRLLERRVRLRERTGDIQSLAEHLFRRFRPSLKAAEPLFTPEAIDDGKACTLSEQIARRIERELQYPGQIKVVVIRETRSVDFAR